MELGTLRYRKGLGFGPVGLKPKEKNIKNTAEFFFVKKRWSPQNECEEMEGFWCGRFVCI